MLSAPANSLLTMSLFRHLCFSTMLQGQLLNALFFSFSFSVSSVACLNLLTEPNFLLLASVPGTWGSDLIPWVFSTLFRRPAYSRIGTSCKFPKKILALFPLQVVIPFNLLSLIFTSFGYVFSSSLEETC